MSNNWYKKSQVQKPKYREGDRISATFNGQPYLGTISVGEEDGGSYMYYIEFDGFEELNQKNELTYPEMDLLEAMEDGIPENQINLIESGVRWEEQDSEFDLTNNEYFLYGTREWDVRKAKRILYQNPRPLDSFNVSSAASLLGSGMIAVGNTDKANIKDPIIMVTLSVGGESGVLPIDGWHRIKKALETNVQDLPAYVLTAEESIIVEVKNY
jgi:hypothetical protein